MIGFFILGALAANGLAATTPGAGHGVVLHHKSNAKRGPPQTQAAFTVATDANGLGNGSVVPQGWAYYYAMTSVGLQERMTELNDKGYVPISLAQYNNGNSFVALWVSPATEVDGFRYWYGATFAEFTRDAAEWSARGYFPVDISGRNLDSGWMTAIMHHVGKNTSVPRTRLVVNLDRQLFDIRNAEARADGMVLASVSFNAKATVNAIWREAPLGLVWSTFIGDTADFLIQRRAAIRDGRRLAFQDISPDGTQAVAVFRNDSVGVWDSAIELSETGLVDYVTAAEREDFFPVSARSRGGAVGNFALITQQSCLGEYCN